MDLLMSIGIRSQLITHPKGSVDNGVPRYKNAIIGNAFAQKILAGGFGGCKMQLSQTRGQNPIGLFGPGGLEIASTQTSLYMANMNMVVKGGQYGAKNSGRIALHQDQVGFLLCQISIQHGDRPRSQSPLGFDWAASS